MSKPGNIWRKVHGKITKKPTNFSWLIEEELAGSGMPTSFDEFNWIVNQGVKSIVTMTENSLPDEWVQCIDYLHVPTPDLRLEGALLTRTRGSQNTALNPPFPRGSS